MHQCHLAPLAGLTFLTWLDLDGNNITDLAPLAGLTSMSVLFLGGNQIDDLTPISGLTSLGFLFADENSISDLSPLVANSGLVSGDDVTLWHNPIDCMEQAANIQALEDRGVDLYVPQCE
jgi:Leucine-rich repeat (LRR) protein